MKSADPIILTINSGSSNIKFTLYQVGELLERRLHGKLDRVGLSGTNLRFSDPSGIEADNRILGISVQDMLFIGDALCPDEKDYPAEEAGVLSAHVQPPHETKRVLEAIIARQDGVQSTEPRPEQQR